MDKGEKHRNRKDGRRTYLHVFEAPSPEELYFRLRLRKVSHGVCAGNRPKKGRQREETVAVRED